MKNFKTFALLSAVCFLLAFVAGCGGRVERSDETNPIPSIPCGQYGDCARYLPCATGGTIECTPTGCVWNGPGDFDLSCAVDADGGSGVGEVSVEISTASSTTVCWNAHEVPMLSLAFTAGPNADVIVDELRLKMTGVGPFTGIKIVRVFVNGDPGMGVTPDEMTGEVVFKKGLPTIPAAHSITLEFRAQFHSVAGATHGLALLDAQSVVLSDGGAVKGSFPMVGNTFTISENPSVCPPCEPTLLVNSSWFASGNVTLGAKNVPMFRMELTPNDCEDVEVKAIDMILTSPDAQGQKDSSLFCKPPCQDTEDWNFGNVKAMMGDATVMGPVGFQLIGNPPLQGNSVTKAILTDPFIIPNGKTTVIEVRMDVAAVEAVPMVGKRFLLDLAGLGAYGKKGLITPTWQTSAPVTTITIVKP